MRFLSRIYALRQTAINRSFCTGTSSNDNSKTLYLENLSRCRSLIRVSGERTEVEPFLQGLMTNDINHVAEPESDAAMYTMFLNKPGRVLFDAIVYKRQATPNIFYIECDRTLDVKVQKHLQLFRVRKKIAIDIVRDKYDIWAAFPSNSVASQKVETNDVDAAIVSKFVEPRLAMLGKRILTAANVNQKDLEKCWPNHQINVTDEGSEYNYEQHRYVHGVCEGASEIPFEKCFPFEVNCDYLHGISFHKGCYLGQEFTARTYHTGVIRKRAMSIRLESSATDDMPLDTPITLVDGKTIGKLKGIRNGHAIGVIRVDLLPKCGTVKIGSSNGIAKQPDWWPVTPTKT